MTTVGCGVISKAMDSLFRVAKVDVTKGYVFGWASIAVMKSGDVLVDEDGEYVPPEVLEEAIYDFVLNSREGGEGHVGSAPARLIECIVTTVEKQHAMGIPPGVVPVGAWVGFKIPPEIAARVGAGSREMFSIEGHAIKGPIDA